jgi:hypothetical protein
MHSMVVLVTHVARCCLMGAGGGKSKLREYMYKNHPIMGGGSNMPKKKEFLGQISNKTPYPKGIFRVTKAL